MANIPGGIVLPGAFSDVQTASRGVSVPGGQRIACFIGTGARSEVIVASALGGGSDGLNSTYTSTTGRDGRHFLLKNVPIISNRTQLFRNGVPLAGLEQKPDANAFNSRYDYRIDITTGQIELQKASLVDKGGKLYTTGPTNVGLGNLDGYAGPNLVDLNAPSEIWTIKCISVQRDTLGQPVQETAKFLAFGSESGVKTDANGNPIVWISNGQDVSNGIIQFAISETKSGSTSTSPFRDGDFFTIEVKSGVLTKNDSLTATYIATADLNSPEFFVSMEELAVKHGPSSLDNTLSLASTLAFANSANGVLALQAKPPMARRTSFNLLKSFDATSTAVDDFVIPLPFGVKPDSNTEIRFFHTNPTTNVETQVVPNKFTYYTLDTAGKPTTSAFVFDNTSFPAGNSFSYSVNESSAVLNFGNDGYLNRSLTSQTTATFSVVGTTFTSSYVGKKLKLFDAINKANDGTWDITAVADGKLTVTASASPPFPVFVNGTGVSFRLINPVTGTVVAGSTATDGVLTSIPSTSRATFASAAINFTGFPDLTGLKLDITNSATVTNKGLFDILSVDGSDVLTISKTFVSESNLDYEVLDTTDKSYYVVVNKNVIPDGNSLRVTLIDIRDATFYDAGWVAALEKLEMEEIDVLSVFPKQTISVIFQNALNHCLTMSNIRNRKERVLFTGAIKGLTPANLIGTTSAAVEDIGILEGIQGDSIAEVLAGNIEDLTNYSVKDSFGHTFRATYFFPDEIVAQVGSENTKIDGFYIAAAAAGHICGTANIAIPITNKVISGFNILRDKQYPIITLEQLAQAGVCILQPVAGGGRVIWGKTTTQSGFPEEEEISIVFIRDRVAKSMRAGFAGFVGLPEDPDTIPMLTTRALKLLQGFVGQKLITDFANLTVKRDNVDPRQFNVKALVQPAYSINWIYINIGVGQT